LYRIGEKQECRRRGAESPIDKLGLKVCGRASPAATAAPLRNPPRPTTMLPRLVAAAAALLAAAAAAAPAPAAAAAAAAASLLLCAPPLGAAAPLRGASNASAATSRVVVMVGASPNALWDKTCGAHGHAACSGGGVGFALDPLTGAFSAAFETTPNDLTAKYVVALVVPNATAAASFADPQGGPLPPALVAAALARATVARVANASAGELCGAPPSPSQTPSPSTTASASASTSATMAPSVAAGTPPPASAFVSASASASVTASASASSAFEVKASSGVSPVAASVLLGALTLLLGVFLVM